MKYAPVSIVLVLLLASVLFLAAPMGMGRPLYADARAPASIAGEVFLDMNGSGARDFGEAGVPDARIRLYNSRGELVASALSDADGYYTFRSLEIDAYTLQVMPPRGYIVLRNGSVTVMTGEVQSPELVSTGLRSGLLYIPLVIH